MKKTIIILSLTAFCFSCSNNQSSKNEKKSETKTASIEDNPDYEKGLNLIAKSDCFGCHKINETSIGPMYSLVAGKYENTPANIELLTEKIQKGGSGNWGQIPMAAHSSLSKEDAVAMVKYILLLKNTK